MASDDERYAEALAYATEKHKGQTRREGTPYIEHPVAVAGILKDWGYGIDYQITGLFHDLLEDTDADESVIEEIGGKEVLEAVKALTKTKGYVLDEYVDGIRHNEMAFRVKAADRLHNLKSAVKTDDEFKRKYIYETLDYYLDFSPEIPKQVRILRESMSKPLTESDIEYEPVDDWILEYFDKEK